MHHLVIKCVLSIIIRDFLVFEIRKNLDLRKILVTPQIFLNPILCRLLGSVLLGEMKFVLSNFVSIRDRLKRVILN